MHIAVQWAIEYLRRKSEGEGEEYPYRFEIARRLRFLASQ